MVAANGSAMRLVLRSARTMHSSVRTTWPIHSNVVSAAHHVGSEKVVDGQPRHDDHVHVHLLDGGGPRQPVPPHDGQPTPLVPVRPST